MRLARRALVLVILALGPGCMMVDMDNSIEGDGEITIEVDHNDAREFAPSKLIDANTATSAGGSP